MKAKDSPDYTHVRRFLFHTAAGSGAAPGLPFERDEKRGLEPPAPVPVFATSRGRDMDKAAEPVGGVLEPAAGLSLVFEARPEELDLAAKKVLFTETALNVGGFLVGELVRPWPRSPCLFFASVSDPPLTLTSAELICSSTLVMRLLAMSSGRGGVPFIVGGSTLPS